MIEDVVVGSANVEINEDLRAHARKAVHALARKYLQHLVRAGVHFAREGHAYRCSVHVQVGALPLMAAEASADETRIALALALDKIAGQMGRVKRARRDDKTAPTGKEAGLEAGLRPAPD